MTKPNLGVVGGTDAGDGAGVGPVVEVPRAPRKLNRNGLAMWRILVPDLIERRQWLKIFQWTAYRYCFAWQMYCRAAAGVEKKGGDKRSTPNGYETESVDVQAMARLSAEMSKLEGQLSLTSQGQAKLQELQLDLPFLGAGGGGNGGGGQAAETPTASKWGKYGTK